MPTLITQNLITTYQLYLDELINTLGKNILLYYPPTITVNDESFADTVREGQLRKPDYKSEDAPTKVENTEIIKALIEYQPKNFISFGTTKDSANVLMLKCFLTDAPKLLRAEYIVPSYDSKDILYTKYRLIREPIPRGLQIDRYCVTYWERM